MTSRFVSSLSLGVLMGLLACGCGAGKLDEPSAPSCELPPREMPYASEVVAFTPGSNAGFGETELPGIVLGPPGGEGSGNGSLSVLSLGVGGEIILAFHEQVIVDGDGPDFVVFENPFLIGGDPETPFAEFAEVAISLDGERWETFPCESRTEYPWPGCAGWSVVEEYDVCTEQLVEGSTGGDLFDLSELGVTRARFVRIRDLSETGGAPTAGFDLDAVGAFHLEADLAD